MLQPGRIDMTEQEAAQLEQIDGKIVALTRRDEGETGPIIATLDDGTEVEVENG